MHKQSILRDWKRRLSSRAAFENFAHRTELNTQFSVKRNLYREQTADTASAGCLISDRVVALVFRKVASGGR
jgi:hypothetical protein